MFGVSGYSGTFQIPVFTNDDPIDKSDLIGIKSGSVPATITLSPENSKGVTRLGAFEEFADRNSGSLAGFLGAIYYPDQTSAQRTLDRVTQMTGASLNGRLPDSLKSEIFEHPEGAFVFRAEYTDRHGAIHGACK